MDSYALPLETYDSCPLESLALYEDQPSEFASRDQLRLDVFVSEESRKDIV